MVPSVGDWAKALENTMSKLAGVSLSGMFNTVAQYMCLIVKHWRYR